MFLPTAPIWTVAPLWMGLEKDLPRGEQLRALLRPFIEHLALSNLSPKTIRRHVDNLWLLGGEIIRDLHYDPALRKRPRNIDSTSLLLASGGPESTLCS
jgi:hypothetical protein